MRLFVGLDLPAYIRSDLTAICAGVHGARWVAPESYHITLRFLGEVDRHTAADLDGLLADIQAPAFDIALHGIGSFGSRGRLRALWAGVEPSGALNHLHDKVARACMRAGFPAEDRKFKPHVTLARFKGVPEMAAASFADHNAGFATRPFTVARFVLFESLLGGEGAHYIPMRTYPLVGFDYDFDGMEDLDDEYADDEADDVPEFRYRSVIGSR